VSGQDRRDGGSGYLSAPARARRGLEERPRFRPIAVPSVQPGMAKLHGGTVPYQGLAEEPPSRRAPMRR